MQSNDDAIFQEIATEIKAVHNGAMEAIKKKDYDAAIKFYKKGLLITEKIGYDEGCFELYFNMANCCLLMENLLEAQSHAVSALNTKTGQTSSNCKALLSSLAEGLKKRGIALEKNGKFHEAIKYYEAAIPYSSEKNRKMMEHEIELLKKYAKNR